MKYTENNHGEQVTVEDVAYFLYQMYGQSAVIDLAHLLEKQGEKISWLKCGACEDESPFFDNACLVCSTTATYPN